MSVKIGGCGVWGKQQTELEENHVVEYRDDQGRTPKIDICPECHAQQEKYKNYLKNVCGIDLDGKNNNP